MNDVYAAPPSQHVDQSVLEQSGKHEHETHGHPDVDRLDVGDSRQRGVDERGLSGGGQHGQQADGDARRARVHVEPERHPRQDDDQHTRNVELNDEITDVANQHEPNLEA